MAEKLKRLALICGLALASGGFASPVLGDEGTLDVSRLPFYDKTNDGTKADIKSYAAHKGAKALAMNPAGRSYWWGLDAKQAEISRRALEDCELSYKSPCVLAAVGDVIQKWDAAATSVSAFATLASELDPAKVPFLSEAGRNGLAVSLEKARNSSAKFMALALHPRNGWYLRADPEFASQADADNAALAACVNVMPPDKWWRRGSCLLFAQGTKIIVDLPLTVTYASAAMVKAAEAAASQNKTTVAARRVDFVYFGASDCPNCRGWEAHDLLDLKASPLFQKVHFTKVAKFIQSPVPSANWFPNEIKHLREPIAEKLQGSGSPMFAIVADDTVITTWKGTWKSPGDILKVFEKYLGEPAPGAASKDTGNSVAAR